MTWDQSVAQALWSAERRVLLTDCGKNDFLTSSSSQQWAEWPTGKTFRLMSQASESFQFPSAAEKVLSGFLISGNEPQGKVSSYFQATLPKQMGGFFWLTQCIWQNNETWSHRCQISQPECWSNPAYLRTPHPPASHRHQENLSWQPMTLSQCLAHWVTFAMATVQGVLSVCISWRNLACVSTSDLSGQFVLSNPCSQQESKNQVKEQIGKENF